MKKMQVTSDTIAALCFSTVVFACAWGILMDYGSTYTATACGVLAIGSIIALWFAWLEH